MTGQEIVKRAESLKNMVYWYGGKRQKCTVKLAQQLKNQNPSVWTDAYYKKAAADITNEKSCCDCSGLVCYAYGIPDIGSYQLKEKYKIWNGSPLPGMIAWKQGHVAIIKDADGHIIEMRGIDYDYQDTRYRKEAGLLILLYDPTIDYSIPPEIDLGWNKDNKGWWYRHTPGAGETTYYHDCFKIINGHCYYFDSEGYINTPAETDSFYTEWVRVKPDNSTGWIDE